MVDGWIKSYQRKLKEGAWSCPYPVTLPCPVLDLRRQNKTIGKFDELLIRDMTLTHVYRREKGLTFWMTLCICHQNYCKSQNLS